MIIPEIKITDIHTLMKVMVRVNQVFGGQIWWRGNPDKSYQLQPSVFRLPEKDGGTNYEDNIKLRFMQKAPALRANTPPKEAWSDWLFLMQHYGLPTRLLDWTESPLVACYFAVNLDIKKTDSLDGAIFALSPYRLNYHRTNNYGLFTADTLPKEYKSLAILPDLVDARMIAQLSVFTIHDDQEALENSESSSDFLVKYEIPASGKGRLREQLKHAGIRPSSIFPDLEHLSEEIKSIRKFKDISRPEKIDAEKLCNDYTNDEVQSQLVAHHRL